MSGLRDVFARVFCVIAMLASGTVAAQEGVVLGSVVDGLGVPLSDTPVLIYDAGTQQLVTGNGTNPDGSFVFALFPGDYHIVAEGTGFIPRAHDGTACPTLPCDFDNIVPLTVLPGSSVIDGVDIVLEWRGGISGQIADTGGAALAGVDVYVFKAVDSSFVRQGATAADGRFLLPLAPGEYLVIALAAGYGTMLFDDVHCPGLCLPWLATQVVVALDAVRANVDFELFQLSTIAGHVYTAGGAPLTGATIYAYTPQAVLVGSTTAGPSGEYLLNLEPGGYFLVFGAEGHRAEVFDNYPCTPICNLIGGIGLNLFEGAAFTGLDATLDPAGSVSGRVMLADGTTPVAGVTVYGVQEGQVTGQFTTAADGAYSLVALTGEVRLRTFNAQGLVDVAYPDLPCLFGVCSAGVGEPIPIEAGQSVGAVDFALSAGGAVSGTVRNVRARGIEGVATLFDDAGNLLGTTGIEDGLYRFEGLPSMAYSLRFDADGYDSQRYDGLPCTPQACDPLAATFIEVAAPQERGAIDAVLDGEGPLQILYLNDCLPSGCVVTRVFGDADLDNAITNVSSIGGGTLAPWHLGEDAFAALTACVTDAFVPYRVSVVRSDPGNVPHREAMVGGLPTNVGLIPGINGVARLDCSYPAGIQNSISFTFAAAIGDSIADLCWTVVHEAGHQFGLDHAFHAPDYMSYLEHPVKDFTAVDVVCGTSTAAPCQCGAPTQNSDGHLRSMLGITLKIFGSGFELSPPDKSWEFLPKTGGVRAPFQCGVIRSGG